MTPTIYLNNSSLSELACGTRYKYRIIRGAVSPKSPELQIGTAFHDIMKDVQQDTHPFLITMAPPESAKKIAPLTLTKIAALAAKTRDQLGELGELRELYLEVDYTAEVKEITPDFLNQDFTAKFCGTLDLISYDDADDSVVITDYKTTQRKIDGKFFTSYDLKSQRPFYINLLQLAANRTVQPWPPKYQAAILNNRVKFRYVFINYVDETIHIQPARFMHAAALSEVFESMVEKLQLAVFLHLNPEAAIKDGIYSDHCYFCPYRNICANFDPAREEDMINAWPYGFKTYDPQHRDI